MALVLCDPSSKYQEINGLKKSDVESLLKWCEMQKYLPQITGELFLWLLLMM